MKAPIAIHTLIDANKEVDNASPADEVANALPQLSDANEDSRLLLR